jgi:hypothetical protein
MLLVTKQAGRQAGGQVIFLYLSLELLFAHLEFVGKFTLLGVVVGDLLRDLWLVVETLHANFALAHPVHIHTRIRIQGQSTE